MAVTLAQYFRRPTTVQYPDRTAVPVVDSLPERYRGFLEVDMDICTACKACERDCPINVIAIDLEKRGAERVMTRFDIDMGKCMYCGICVESCPVPAQAPGDAEPTKCIRMTREFEGATSDFPSLTFRFVKPGRSGGGLQAAQGRGAGDAAARAHRAPGAAARAVGQRDGVPLVAGAPGGRHARRGHPHRRGARARRGAGSQDGGGSGRRRAGGGAGRRRLAAPGDGALAAPGDGALAALLVAEALAQTDCEKCGWPTCRAYAEAIAGGQERALHKCEPGGAKATRDVHLFVQLRRGKTPAEAAAHATSATLRHHR